ncbi:hypothetical protein Leryth_022739 [Lithospermum erythrorhizon]|nr:hypothetical protein Leryth_022739 [Lithospermum erythrorhizon]
MCNNHHSKLVVKECWIVERKRPEGRCRRLKRKWTEGGSTVEDDGDGRGQVRIQDHRFVFWTGPGSGY